LVQLRGQPFQDVAQQGAAGAAGVGGHAASGDPLLGSLTIDLAIVRSGTRTVRAWQFSGLHAKVYLSLEWRGF
jgi:hypothetical protein